MALSADLQEHKVSNRVIALNAAIMAFVGSWFLDFQFLQILVTWIVGALILLGLAFIGFISASWDLLRNPWIEDMNFSRWNRYTTGHYGSWLLHKDERMWLRQLVFFCLPISMSAAIFLFNLPNGIASIILSIIISHIIGLAEWYRKS